LKQGFDPFGLFVRQGLGIGSELATERPGFAGQFGLAGAVRFQKRE